GRTAARGRRSQPHLGAEESAQPVVASRVDGTASREDVEDEEQRRGPLGNAEYGVNDGGDNQGAAERFLSRGRRRRDARGLERAAVPDREAAVRALPVRGVHE